MDKWPPSGWETISRRQGSEKRKREWLQELYSGTRLPPAGFEGHQAEGDGEGGDKEGKGLRCAFEEGLESGRGAADGSEAFADE